MLITDLGHDEPTVLLTNDLRTSAAKPKFQAVK
jgi:hypothetical protein